MPFSALFSLSFSSFTFTSSSPFLCPTFLFSSLPPLSTNTTPTLPSTALLHYFSTRRTGYPLRDLHCLSFLSSPHFRSISRHPGGCSDALKVPFRSDLSLSSCCVRLRAGLVSISIIRFSYPKRQKHILLTDRDRFPPPPNLTPLRSSHLPSLSLLPSLITFHLYFLSSFQNYLPLIFAAATIITLSNKEQLLCHNPADKPLNFKSFLANFFFFWAYV